VFKKCTRSLSLIITILLVLTIISGCTVKDKDEPKDKETSKLSESTISNGDGRPMEGNLYLQGVPIVKEKETFEIMITYNQLGAKQPEDLLVYKERAESTNVDIKFNYVLQSAVSERKATMFATGDLPDALVNIITTDEVVRYAPTGAIIPIDQFIERYTPRFKRLMAEFPDIRRLSTMPDGKIYGFPMINFYSVWPGDGVMIVTSWVINQEWLDKLGLNKPTTTEELKFVLNEFKTKDPNGNNKADEIPYSFSYNGGYGCNFGEAMFGPFGLIGPGTNVNVQNGKVFFPVTDPKYKEVVKYVRDLYTNGLIDQEAFTHTVEQYRGKGQAEVPVYGLINGWMGDTEVGPTRIKHVYNPEGTYEPLPPVEGPDGTRLWGNTSAGVGVNRCVITNKCKSPEILARYIDELYEEENSVQECWGVFNRNVKKKEDGTYVRMPALEGWNNEEWLMDTTTRVMPYAVTYDIANRMYIQPPDLSQEPISKKGEGKYVYASVYAPFATKEYYPNVVRPPEEIDEIGRLLPQLNNLIKQKEVEWMTGIADIDKEYDAFLKELKEYKIDRIVELYQDAYDRYMRD
jgi:putative aldouronate transport system substrate-binding protein